MAINSAAHINILQQLHKLLGKKKSNKYIGLLCETLNKYESSL